MKSFVLVITVIASVTISFAQSAIGTVVTISGYILNANTLTAVEANYGIYEVGGRKVGQSNKSNERDGYLVTGLKPGEQYTLRVEDPRYFKQEYRIDVPKAGKYLELSKDIVVRPLETGRTINVSPVPFDLKKTSIKQASEGEVEQLAQMLVMNPGVNIEIICYPDEEGTTEANQKVSMDRAQSLRAALVKAGVNSNRVTLKSAETTDPLNPPPLRKGAKGKRYVGPVYLTITKV
jgi:outer membrane protein OmpA-like peptidoglycan-associated protein